VDGKLNVGLLTCPDLASDLWDLVHGFGTQLEELVAAVDADLDKEEQADEDSGE